jgi:alpha-amylase/alpha-mannosidase (GH57 family)
MSNIYLCVHGHFYQPPRENPATGQIAVEAEAAPYHDFNEKIWDECYRPNAEAGNFARLSFNLGPTLASWLERAHPQSLATIVESVSASCRHTGHGNALAQSYHHTILPLATRREKRLQIAWGKHAFMSTFGHAPTGMWLPEAAVDDETLDEVAAQDIKHVILAPWQAGEASSTPDRAYRVAVGGNREITVVFYNATLSGKVSFDDHATLDAARFCTDHLVPEVQRDLLRSGRDQLLLVATDGEVYGHHKRFRNQFLQHLLAKEAPSHGFTPITLDAYLAQRTATETATVKPRTSWSCSHGIARWDSGCTCTVGDSSWKRPLRRALRALAGRVDGLFEAETEEFLAQPWQVLEHYIELRVGSVTPDAFWARHARRPLTQCERHRLHGLLEMQFDRQAMFVSCAWFFEDLDRIEPRIALTHARRAIRLAEQHTGANLAADFRSDLVCSVSLLTGVNAAGLYDALED